MIKKQKGLNYEKITDEVIEYFENLFANIEGINIIDLTENN